MLGPSPVSVLLPLAALATALACVGIGASSSLGSAFGWAVVGGLGNGVYGISFLTTLQARTPAKHQTCVNALYELVGSVAPGIGFLVGGIVATASSPRAVYIVAGLGGVVVVVISAALLRQADWSLAPISPASIADPLP